MKLKIGGKVLRVVRADAVEMPQGEGGTFTVPNPGGIAVFPSPGSSWRPGRVQLIKPDTRVVHSPTPRVKVLEDGRIVPDGSDR